MIMIYLLVDGPNEIVLQKIIKSKKMTRNDRQPLPLYRPTQPETFHNFIAFASVNRFFEKYKCLHSVMLKLLYIEHKLTQIPTFCEV